MTSAGGKCWVQISTNFKIKIENTTVVKYRIWNTTKKTKKEKIIGILESGAIYTSKWFSQNLKCSCFWIAFQCRSWKLLQHGAFPQESASIEPLFWHFDAPTSSDFDIFSVLTIFWYFSSPSQQNASTNILTWKSAPSDLSSTSYRPALFILRFGDPKTQKKW